jgi:hypothetical protein
MNENYDRTIAPQVTEHAIQVQEVEVHLSQDTLKALVAAVTTSLIDRGSTPYDNSPMPTGPITKAATIKAQRARGVITVASDISGVVYKIGLGPNFPLDEDQQDLGYKLVL